MAENQRQKIVVRLTEQKEALWRQFATHTNEMTANTEGKKLFPTLNYYIDGLDADQMYEIVLEIHQANDYRYTFYKDRWVDIGTSKVASIEANKQAKKIRHVDGVMTGKEWMASQVNFDHVRLTSNSKTENPSHVYLPTMFKYVPVLSIYEVMPTSKPIVIFKFDYTEFIMVRAYRNPAIRSMKISINPFCQQQRNHAINKKRCQTIDESLPPLKQAKLGVVSPEADILPDLKLSTFSSMHPVVMKSIPFFQANET